MAGGANSGGPGLAPPHQEQPPNPQISHHIPPGAPGINPGPAQMQHGPFGNYQHPPAGMNGELSVLFSDTMEAISQSGVYEFGLNLAKSTN